MMQYRTKQAPGLNCWLSQLMARTHQNVAVVALANKLLRMAWAVLCKNETYRIPVGYSPLSQNPVKNSLPGLLADYRDGTTVEQALSKFDIGRGP